MTRLASANPTKHEIASQLGGLDQLTAPHSFVPLKDRLFTGPRGAILPVGNDPDIKQILVGVIKARVLIYDPDAPHRVVLRQGGSKLWSIPGGTLEPGEHPVEAACRETREESGITQIPNLRLVTVLTEQERLRIPRDHWTSWEYPTRGRECVGERVLLGSMKTAFFAAPLSEPFRKRSIEDRIVEIKDLAMLHPESIRPAFRHLLRCWRGDGRDDIPLNISHGS